MKQFLVLVVLVLALSSCKKDTNMYGVDCSENKTKASQTEIDSIGRYLAWRNENGANINATLHPNGFYYVIIEQGTGTARAETCSAVNVDYQGRRYGAANIEGTVFDERTGTTLNLYQVIAGWQQALPLLATGGKIHLYLPPSLGYGASGSGTIKSNTYLFFEITLNYFN